MRKESVALRAQVAAATGVRARGVAGTTAVGPAAADHHPPRVAATSRRVIRREYPIFTPVRGALCLCLCLILNLSFFLSFSLMSDQRLQLFSPLSLFLCPASRFF
jgi:hypothetical protein